MADKDIQGAMLEALNAITTRIESMSAGGDGNSETLARLAELQKTIADQNNATLKQIHRPRNEFPPLMSVFNPRGDKDYPRPLLKCEMFTPWFRPWDPGSLTREEVELLNLLDEGEYTMTRNDGTKVVLPVIVKYKLGTKEPERITITHESAFKNEEQARNKSLADTLRSMLGRKAKDVITMEEEEAYIRLGQLNDGTQSEQPVSVGA